MAKGSNDVILRDRLQFDIKTDGDIDLVYGRIDLSDYVSIVENKGLAIKEIRFQPRTSATRVGTTGSWPQWMLDFGTLANATSELKMFATTTAYENAFDVGIGSPNVLCIYERQTTQCLADPVTGADTQQGLTEWNWWGTPDLHPEGYDVVTDLLIGVSGFAITRLADATCELDVMIIAEPKKITQKDMTQMLTQAQDL